MERFVVENDERLRLDLYLVTEMAFSRSYITKLNDKGNITVNGEVVKCGKMLKSGDIITVVVPEEKTDVEPENIPLDIIYEDRDIAVINKPQGMIAHPAPGVYTGTLVNALLYHLKDLSTINGVIRPGIVHRLDKDTSGVMVIAKNDKAHLSLSNQWLARTVSKSYLALATGVTKEKDTRVETFLARSTRDRTKIVVASEGRKAISIFHTINVFGGCSEFEVEILTGRTHQIRVHASYIGCPIIGDSVYGGNTKLYSFGQLLHSHRLCFNHPSTGERMVFEVDAPSYYQEVKEKLLKR